ncbi:MAG TPA: hypothetical protein VFX25_10705 [Streptosporangiaceae bacterium]|nr:hypothetical protein [Streptosporangiaceae bacterium]HEX5289333.1 hypothetical protein [Streptosporangiaceae bacterium]
MTELATAPHSALRTLAGQYRQLRTAHPVRVLRWLRNGMLLAVAAAVVLYVWVAIQAGHDISAARRTSQGIFYIGKAAAAAHAAGTALSRASATEDVTLTGTGGDYVNQVTQVEKYLALVAEDNAAGAEGTTQLQFIQGQLGTYLTMSETAIRDYRAGGYLGPAAESYASVANREFVSDIRGLGTIEGRALSAQRRAWPLDPATFWWVLLAPVIGALLTAGATAHVLARHFRRPAGPRLWGSLLITAATMIAAGFFNWHDERQLAAKQQLAATQWAGHPVTMTAALLLFLCAAVLAYLAYRPRLAEYRFKPS